MLVLKVDVSDVEKGFKKWDSKFDSAMALYAESTAKTFEAYAKRNYLWTDRTHMASKTLKGKYEWRGPTLRVQLEHGMHYGKYLEYANGGKYAILGPTIKLNASQALRGLNILLK